MSHTYERVQIPMRDQMRLSAALFRPAEAAPVLVLRTPYGIDTTPHQFPDVTRALNAGYGLVWVACRGTFGSEGQFRRMEDERDDGFDTVEWVIAQSWCNGTIGTYGGSYHGMTQWALLSEAHPAVKASAISVASMNSYVAPWYHPGGALSLSNVGPWHLVSRLNEETRALATGSGDLELVTKLAGGFPPGQRLYGPTPLTAHPLLGADDRWQTLIGHPSYDEHWQSVDFTRSVSKMTAPVLSVAGWYDPFVVQQLRDFALYVNDAATRRAREGSRLIVGPWDHLINGANFPDRDFGPFAGFDGADLVGEHLGHFDRWLHSDDDDAREAISQVKLFVMGINQWREEQSWPIRDTHYADFYLKGGSQARDGRLGNAKQLESSSLAYLYDPRDPVPTTGGAHVGIHRADGPVDQRALDDRADILTFQTPVLTHDTEVTGYVSAILHVTSDVVDTDFTAKLIDVYPDGRALHLCDGILRVRYRGGLEHAELMQPGQVYEIEIDMAATSNVFLAGHRIRLDISSSNYPRFDRNTNTGGHIQDEAIENAVTARNVVLCGSDHPSRLRLPVIARSLMS